METPSTPSGFLTALNGRLIMEAVEEESTLHFWAYFVRVFLIAGSIFSFSWLCSITIDRIFDSRLWKKQTRDDPVVTTTKFVKAQPALFKRTRWTFAEGSALAGLVLGAGIVGIPSWTAAICLVFSSPVYGPVAGSILAAIDIAIAAAILWRTDGFEMHKK